MAYSEIVNEIQEQIDELQARHDAIVTQISDLQGELPTLVNQIESLTALKAQASSISSQFDVNVNVRVTADDSSGNSTVSVVNHNVSPE